MRKPTTILPGFPGPSLTGPNPVPSVPAAALLAGLFLTVGAANADIPAGYKGTPFGGTPRTIPGRIDFEDYDLGGVNVAWKTDNKAGAAGSNAAGRESDGEKDHPAFYTTNTNPGEVDKLPDNTLYPSDANPKSVYIGATHASDWANVTVNVAQAGTYWLSTHYGGENGTYKFSVRFNNVNKTGSISLPGTNNYHNWRFYRNFAKVELEAGVQVMQYMVESQHINWDYLYLSADSNGVVGLNPAASAGTPVLGAWLAPQGTAGPDLLRFILPANGPARIFLTDLSGRERGLLLDRTMRAGSHSLSLKPLGAGVRYLRVTQNGSGVSLAIPSAL
jgi:hypothetical protein